MIGVCLRLLNINVRVKHFHYLKGFKKMSPGLRWYKLQKYD